VFEFGFGASLYADDAATPVATRVALLAGTNAIYAHLRLLGLFMHVGLGRANPAKRGLDPS
jgi:hypothetical protein